MKFHLDIMLFQIMVVLMLRSGYQAAPRPNYSPEQALGQYMQLIGANIDEMVSKMVVVI